MGPSLESNGMVKKAAKGVSSVALQWGRRSKATECFFSRLPLPPTIRFNGAVARKQRNGPSGAEHRHGTLRFNGAVARKQRNAELAEFDEEQFLASMGPSLESNGMLDKELHPVGVLRLASMGPSLESNGMFGAAGAVLATLVGFNGAVARKQRNGRR